MFINYESKMHSHPMIDILKLYRDFNIEYRDHGDKEKTGDFYG